jgi:hypothetical protein
MSSKKIRQSDPHERPTMPKVDDAQPDAPLRTVMLVGLTPDQEDYVAKIEKVSGCYDRSVILGGPGNILAP